VSLITALNVFTYLHIYKADQGHVQTADIFLLAAVKSAITQRMENSKSSREIDIPLVTDINKIKHVGKQKVN